MPNRPSRRQDATTLWRRLAFRPRVELLSAIFLLFSSVGFLADVALLNPRRPWWVVAIQVVYAGLVAIGYALSFLQQIWLLTIVLFAQFAGAMWLRSVLPGFWAAGDAGAPFPGLHVHLGLDAAGILAGVVTSYMLFIRFVTREGARHVRLEAEVELAGAVQAQLVPPIDRSWGKFEIAGSSLPSSEIGGDLVDLFEVDGRAVVYLADVSGHGIAAGNLMGMVKTAARMSLHAGARLDIMFSDLNRVLGPLKTPGRFVTLAALELRAADRIEVALAGHLPILRFGLDRAISRVENQHVPVGIAPETRYGATTLPVAPGDLLVIVSDGITERLDPQGQELGIEGVERLLLGLEERRPRAVVEALLAAAKTQGQREDDQSVLVVRVG